MPLYDFECRSCGNVFEELIFDDDENVPCQKCQSMETFQKVAAPSPLKTNPFPYKTSSKPLPKGLLNPKLNRTCPNKSSCSASMTAGTDGVSNSLGG